MTHGRKPRKPRRRVYTPMAVALLNVSKLTPTEVADTLQPARQCFDRLREGVATEDQHTVLYTTLAIAMGIESAGIVRGLSEHLAAAIDALTAVRARAMVTGSWRPTPLYFYELDAIAEGLDLHKYQLRLVSAGELHGVASKLIAQTQSAGGLVVRTSASIGQPGATA